MDRVNRGRAAVVIMSGAPWVRKRAAGLFWPSGVATVATQQEPASIPRKPAVGEVHWSETAVGRPATNTVAMPTRRASTP